MVAGRSLTVVACALVLGKSRLFSSVIRIFGSLATMLGALLYNYIVPRSERRWWVLTAFAVAMFVVVVADWRSRARRRDST
jgi:hypothetical protein